MSEYKMLFCAACDKRIEIGPGEEFNYTADADGPFCDRCWFFVLHIEALRDRVTDLEKEVRGRLTREHIQKGPTRFGRDRTSPYNCSQRRSRVGRPIKGGRCP